MVIGWPRFNIRARRLAPVVAFDWSDNHWLAAWVDPQGSKRQYHTCPVAATDGSDTAAAPSLDWAPPLRRWLQEQVGSIQGWTMALSAGAVSHEWVWGAPDEGVDNLSVNDGQGLIAAMPSAWHEAGWSPSPAAAHPKHMDVCPIRAAGASGATSRAMPTAVDRWWVAAEPWVVERHRALADRAGGRLWRLDVRAAALARALQARHSGDWPVVLIDFHRGQTQWMVVDAHSVRTLQSFAHRRLSPAEHSDHLLAQLQGLADPTQIQACVCTGEAPAPIATVAQALGWSVSDWPRQGDNLAVCTAMVDGLLDALSGEPSRVL